MTTQVQDDPQLLELMLKDAAVKEDVYQTTNYWAVKEKTLVPELRRMGLTDFRRRKGSFLRSFGATDFLPSTARIDLYRSSVWNSRALRTIPGWSHIISFSNKVFNKLSPKLLPVVSDITAEQLRESSYEFAKLFGIIRKAKDVSAFSASNAGNPEDFFTIEGKNYTSTSLYYYMRYAYCAKFIDFNSVNILVELGCGSGKQIEVFKKLYPDICFVLFDIPPQLYVCEQYLKAVFPDSVVSYADTRDMSSIPFEKGKIFMMGNWKFPVIEKLPIDLFWNAASFQEMEPDVVNNYLQYVNRNAKNVYLQELMEGQAVANKEGSKGVLRRTVFEDYSKGLPDFKCIDIVDSWTPTGILREIGVYSDSFWVRKDI